jgi:anthranilate synthase component 1
LLTSDAIYRENPTALFHQLCGARPATLLLESADIDSKDDLKSLLLVDSALRITALGDTVTIQALSANGASLLPLLDAALPSGIENQRQPMPHLPSRRSAPCSMKTPACVHCRF